MEKYQFSNWAGIQTCTPELYFEPSTTEEIKEIIERARKEGRRVKIQGFGHSPNDIACTDGYMMYLKKMDAVVDVNEEKFQVTVQAGCSLKTLGVDILPKYGMALPVIPAVGEPTIAGAISTGSHGTGKEYGVLGSYVTGVKLLTASGEIITCTKEENSDILRACVCSLGCLGVILEVTLQCHPAYQVHSIAEPSTLDSILDRLDTFVDECDHAKLFWCPHTENVIVFRDTRTKDQPVRNEQPSWFWSRLIGHHFHEFCMWIGYLMPSLQPTINVLLFKLLSNYKADRVDVSYKMLTFHCLYSQWINEWAIPIEKTKEVFRELKSTIDSTPGLAVHFPFEVRFAKGDDGMLSPAHGRDTCFLSIIHFRPYGKGVFNTKLWNLFEDVVKKCGGRPHWAKNHQMTAGELKKVYPEMDKFCAIRKRLDPDGIFLNSYLERIFEVTNHRNHKKEA